jgi:nucleoside-diphosphate-sugar epimerase
MNARIAVLGATGVYGRHLVPRLIAAGYRVRALARRPEAVATIATACGAEVAAADIFDEASLRAGLAGCEVAINLATSLPAPGEQGDYAKNDQLRREGTPIFVRACREVGVSRVLQQSIAMTHAGGGDQWADETTFHPPGEGIAGAAIAAVRAMEAAVVESDLDWVILRGALFYGPGTGFDDDWFARARAGKLRLPAAGNDYVSLVHIADMAAATVAAIRHWPSRQALIVADDCPAPWRDVLTYVCAIAGSDPPPPGGRASMPSFRVKNARARELLGWEPAYRDYREGLIR